jgi:hypothetical protein
MLLPLTHLRALTPSINQACWVTPPRKLYLKSLLFHHGFGRSLIYAVGDPDTHVGVKIIRWIASQHIMKNDAGVKPKLEILVWHRAHQHSLLIALL